MNLLDPIGILVVLGVATAGTVLFSRSKDPARRARFLRRTGMTVMLVAGAIFGVFVVGESFTDPGGWVAVGLTAVGLLPLTALLLVAWFRPRTALPLLVALTIGAVGLIAWRALDPGLRDLEDRVGPFTTVATTVVAVAVAFLAHTRARMAGIILLAIGAAPALSWAFVEGPRPLGTAYMILGSPVLLSGILLLISDVVARRGAPPRAEDGPRHDLAKAA